MLQLLKLYKGAYAKRAFLLALSSRPSGSLEVVGTAAASESYHQQMNGSPLQAAQLQGHLHRPVYSAINITITFFCQEQVLTSITKVGRGGGSCSVKIHEMVKVWCFELKLKSVSLSWKYICKIFYSCYAVIINHIYLQTQ